MPPRRNRTFPSKIAYASHRHCTRFPSQHQLIVLPRNDDFFFICRVASKDGPRFDGKPTPHQLHLENVFFICFHFYFVVFRRRSSIARAPLGLPQTLWDLRFLSGGTSPIFFPRSGCSHTPVYGCMHCRGRLTSRRLLVAEASSVGCQVHKNRPTVRRASVGRPVKSRPNLGYF